MEAEKKGVESDEIEFVAWHSTKKSKRRNLNTLKGGKAC